MSAAERFYLDDLALQLGHTEWCRSEDVAVVEAKLAALTEEFDRSIREAKEGYRAELERSIRLEAELAPYRADDPDIALLASMATCERHDFSLLSKERQAAMLTDMRKLWDEVVGRGYYKPENRGRYTKWLKDHESGGEGVK